MQYGERTLSALHQFPLDLARGHRVGISIDHHPAEHIVVEVGHADGGGGVIEEIHDTGNRMNPQKSGDVFALFIKQVLPLGSRSAIRAHVTADARTGPLLFTMKAPSPAEKVSSVRPQ